MRRMKAWNNKNYFFVIALIGAALFSPLGAKAQVILELIDPVSGTNTATLTPGQSGSFEFVVTGLSASQPLDSFSLTFAVGSNGFLNGGNITFLDYTSALPTGWASGTLQVTAPFSGNNVSGSDISGTSILGTIDFTISSNWPVGTPLQFVYDPGPDQFQFLHDNLGNDISYSEASALVNIVPEPCTYLLLVGGFLFLLSLPLRRPRIVHRA